MKRFFAALSIIVIALIAVLWSARDSSFVRQFTQSGALAYLPNYFANDVQLAPAEMDTAGRTPGSQSGLKKCVRGTEILYTDAPCPPGSRDQQLTSGAVSVVPGQSASAASKSADAAASLPNARDLLLPKDDVNLRERYVERVIGK